MKGIIQAPILLALGIIGLLGLISFNQFQAEQSFGAQPALTVPAGGTGTSTFTGGKLLSGSTALRLTEVSTTSASCAGSASCSAFTVIGASPITITGAAGGGSGSISTSSPGVVSSLLFYTTAGATPELVDPVTTTTLTASAPLSLSAAVAKVGGSNSVLTLDTSGAWSGTAAALAANAANCSAGSGAGGVTATGAAEDCTDYEQSLTAGDHLTRTADDFDVDDDFILDTGDIGTGSYTFPYASTTAVSTAYASSTLYFGAGLANCSSGNMLTFTDGRFGCEDDSTAVGAADPFTWATNFGVKAAATTSALWLQTGALFSSSTNTSYFDGDVSANTLRSISVFENYNQGGIDFYSDEGVTQIGTITAGPVVPSEYNFYVVGVNLYGKLDFTGITLSDKTFTLPNWSGTFCLVGVNCAATTTSNTWAGLQTLTYASSTAFSTPYASSTALFAGGLTISPSGFLTIGGDAIDEFVGTGLSLSSGDLQTTLGTAIVSTEITDNEILEADLKVVDTAGDEEIFTFESTGGDFEWHTGAELCEAITGSSELCDADDATAAGSADPFSWAQNYATTSAATSTAIWARNGVFASSTSHIASTTFAITGNIGIGTPTPAKQLVVLSTVPEPRIRIIETADTLTSHYSGLDFYDDTTFKGGFFKEGTTHRFAIWNAASEVLSILQTSNNVGIGTTSPYRQLSVSNNAVFGGDVLAGYFTATSTSNASTFTNSSTTLGSFGYASSTLYYGAGLADCNTGNMLTWTAGRFGCEDDTEGSGGDYPFTPQFYEALYQATSSRIMASSTVAINATTTNATTTNLNISGQIDVDGLTSALVLTGAGGVFAEYAGAGCTNQVVEDISALGASTCVSIESEQLGDDDWGELTVASGVVTIDDDVILAANFADEDWGDITISANAAAVEDNSHAHDATTISGLGTDDISGLDISADTNLTAGDNLTLTDDDLDLDTTLTGLTRITSTYASTTAISTAYASSTLWYGGGLLDDCDSDNVLTWTAGRFGCEADDQGAGGGWPFTPTTYDGVPVQSTTTPLWLKTVGLFATSSVVGNATTTNATSTTLNVSGQVDFDGLTSALVLAGSGGILGEYGGAAACTNQFVTAISTTGGTTCASINNGQWSGTDLSVANGGTGLSTFGGTNTPLFTSTTDNLTSDTDWTYNGTTNLMTLLYASTTALTVSSELVVPQNKTVSVAGEITVDDTTGQIRYYANSVQNVVSPIRDLGFAYATSTWTGTTTLRIGPSPAAITFKSAYCETNTGTVGVSLYDGTNRANYIPTASTTINKFAYSSNNTFTAGETIRVDLGNPASTPTTLSCRFLYTYDAD